MNDKSQDETLIEQGQVFAANMAEVFDISQQIWTKFLDAHKNDAQHPGPADPLNTLPAFVSLSQAMMDNPQQVADATLQFWSAQAQLWQNMTQKWIGGEGEPQPIELPFNAEPGKRFQHKDWSENAVFEYLKQSYLLTSGWMNNTVHELGEMDPRSRKKAEFYTRSFAEALNPANFFALNPEVVESTSEQKGSNLGQGLKMMLEDLERGKGHLLIRQTDMDAFKVGRDMAVSEGSVIWECDLCQLIQYAPTTAKVHNKPLLFIPPWINKFYVLDLNPRKSMVRWLVEQGYTVFMLSWVNPDERQKDVVWESYMDAAWAAIDAALAETGQKSLNVTSYCIGGTLLSTMMAEAGRKKDKRIASATFFTSQLDFEDAGELQVFVDDHTIRAVDGEMEKGYLPAEKLASAFNMLRSNDLIWSYVVNNYMLGKDPFPFDLLYWNADSTAMPARVHHFYLEQFYDWNAFAGDELDLRGERVHLGDIHGPVYHVATKEDHIAPAKSVYAGAQMMTRADVRFVLAGSGHIAGVVNPPALGKYQHWINDDLEADTLEDWLAGTQEQPGSWWSDWDAWLTKRSGSMVKARVPGAKSGVIEAAPGRYVQVRFDQR